MKTNQIESKIAMGSRPLTDGERNILTEVYGTSIDLDSISVSSDAILPGQGYNSVTPNNTIYANNNYSSDFSNENLHLQAHFVHESFHAYEFQQQGYSTTFKSLLEQIPHQLGFTDAYNLDGVNINTDFNSLSNEQQASAVQFKYLYDQGMTYEELRDEYGEEVYIPRPEVLNAIVPDFESIEPYKAPRNIFQKIGDGIAAIGRGIANTVKAVASAVGNVVSKVAGAVSSVVKKVAEAVSSVVTTVPARLSDIKTLKATIIYNTIVLFFLAFLGNGSNVYAEDLDSNFDVFEAPTHICSRDDYNAAIYLIDNFSNEGRIFPFLTFGQDSEWQNNKFKFQIMARKGREIVRVGGSLTDDYYFGFVYLPGIDHTQYPDVSFYQNEMVLSGRFVLLGSQWYCEKIIE